MKVWLKKICQVLRNFIFQKKDPARYTIWARNLIRIERGYDVSYVLSVGCRNIVLSLSFAKQSENVYVNILCPFCCFSCRCKVIIKCVSNTIWIFYSITIIKGECSWYTGSYIFLNSDVDKLDAFKLKSVKVVKKSCGKNIVFAC